MVKKLITVILFLYLALLALIYIDALSCSTKHADYAVVLGNKVELDGKPSKRLKARLDRAVSLYNEGIADAVVVSGGAGKEGFDEAIVMAEYLLSRGIPNTSVLLDHNGYTTHATAVNTFDMLGEECSVIGVTQMFHISRTKLSLRNAGFVEVYGAYPSYFEIRDIYSSLREVPAWIKYWLKGS